MYTFSCLNIDTPLITKFDEQTQKKTKIQQSDIIADIWVWLYLKTNFSNAFWYLYIHMNLKVASCRIWTGQDPTHRHYRAVHTWTAWGISHANQEEDQDLQTTMEGENQNCYRMKKAKHFHMHHMIDLDQEIIHLHDPR